MRIFQYFFFDKKNNSGNNFDSFDKLSSYSSYYFDILNFVQPLLYYESETFSRQLQK